MHEIYIARDAFLKHFKFGLKGNIPDVETSTENNIGLSIQACSL